MLRRVSDRIRVDLDAYNVDEAAQVSDYRVRDVVLTLDVAREQVILRKAEELQVVSLEQLRKSPSSVFKVLVALVQK